MASPDPVASPAPPVKTTPPIYLRAYAVSVLCTVSAGVFFLTGVTPLPVLLYFPLSRRFAFSPVGASGQTELNMDFYGRSLLALLAGLSAALFTFAILRLRKSGAKKSDDPAPDSTAEFPTGRLLLLTAYATTALAFAAGLYAYQLWGRQPTPVPFPVGHSTEAPADIADDASQ